MLIIFDVNSTKIEPLFDGSTYQVDTPWQTSLLRHFRSKADDDGRRLRSSVRAGCSMPHDPELIAETRAWFVKAGQDLGAAAHEFKAEPPFLADIVFHPQQAAEKAFKGFLTWHSTPFRKTHNLEEIGEQCLQHDPTLKLTVERAVPLTTYAWKFRYPDDPDEPTREEAEKALALAREVFDAVLMRLPLEVRP